MKEEKHILSILVDNQPGVLSRIVGLFSGRGYNIESLCVAETNEPHVSRLTMVTEGDAPILEQIKKQLNKLINVIKVSDLTAEDTVVREMVLVKVSAKPSTGRKFCASAIFSGAASWMWARSITPSWPPAPRKK
jgi:acetolactate synthase I/III small subunit